MPFGTGIVRLDSHIRLWMLACAIFAASLFSIGSAELNAGQERYDYDELGRLIRVIDEQGRVTSYVYDAAGNLLLVVRGDTGQTPGVLSIAPDTVRIGSTRRIQVTGTGLIGTSVVTSDPKLTAVIARATLAGLSIDVSAADATTLGSKQLTFANAAGSAATTITVLPELTLSSAPAEISIPSDSVSRRLSVLLSDAEPIPTTFSVSLFNTTFATVSPPLVTVPAGQTELQLTIIGKQAGRTTLNISSTSLRSPAAFPVFVGGDSFMRSAGLGVFLPPTISVSNSLASRALGVLLPLPRNVNASLASSPLGVAFGPVARSIEPTAALISTDFTLTIRGFGLDAVTGMTLSPPEGITVGSPLQASPDGTQLTVPISVSAGAAAIARTVMLSSATGRVDFSNLGNADLYIASAPPAVASLAPQTVNAGTTFTLAIGGSNLFGANAVLAEPADGISFASGPTVSTDGTQAIVGVSIAPTTNAGARVIRVVTPIGTSPSGPAAGNTLAISSP